MLSVILRLEHLKNTLNRFFQTPKKSINYLMLFNYFYCTISIVFFGCCSARPQFNSNPFLNQPGQFPQQFPQFQQQQQPQQPPLQQPATTAAAPPTTAAPVTTTPGPAFFRCFESCPTTSQYSPVCGSDAQNYHNDQKLRCTNECGRRVNNNWTGLLVLQTNKAGIAILF